MAAGQPPLPVPRESHSHVPAGLGLCGSAAAHPWAGQRGSPALPPPRHPDHPRREPQPSPSAPRGHGLPLPLASNFVTAPCGQDGPGDTAHSGAGEPGAASTPQPLRGCSRLSQPVRKRQEVCLPAKSAAVSAASVPGGRSQPEGGQSGCASLRDAPKPRRPPSPALRPCRARRSRCGRAKGCRTPVKITLSGCPSHFPKH